MDDYRESIWGIRPEDRKWFQLFTVVGGTAGSVVLAVLELDSPAVDVTLAETARNIVLGIGASFVASGFIVWGLLQVRENMSSLAAWIRENTKKRQEQLLEQGREEGVAEGILIGREQILREIYGPDYVDFQGDKPAQTSDEDDSSQESTNGV